MSTEVVRIQTVINRQALPVAPVIMYGRVKTNRCSNKVGFLEINDGGTLANLQVVYKPTLCNFVATTKLKIGTYVRVKGRLVAPTSGTPPVELQAQMVQAVQGAVGNFALQKAYHTPAYLRSLPHLRGHTRLINIINRVKSFVVQEVHVFFRQAGFYHVMTPTITTNDCEGGGAVFYLVTSKASQEPHFFKRAVNLTVSGQLYAEALAQSLARVYTLAPAFRAERSSTARHAAEFWMLEAELLNTNLQDNMTIIEQFMTHIIRQYTTHFATELKFLETYTKVPLTAELKRAAQGHYPRLDYDRVVKILHRHQHQFKNQRVFWGMNLEFEHEQFIARRVTQQPCFITNFPKQLKPFYMHTNPDQQTVAACDLITPVIGELVGGSVREANYQVLRQNCQQAGVNTTTLDWYLQLRRTGYAPSSGFGLGFERLIMYLTGVSNIRDIIAFPRIYHEAGI